MKTVYFIRHGESEGNAGPIHLDANAPLTERGREQATFMAERIARLPIDALISSTMLRAKDTAAAIGKHLGMEAEEEALFVERKWPSVRMGRPKDEPSLIELDQVLFDNFGVAGFRHSDEENFDDLKERARKALAYLAARPEKNIAVVMHGFFLRMIVAVALFGEALNSKEGERFIRGFHMENTGLTALIFNESRDPNWRLWIWNDHAHLS